MPYHWFIEEKLPSKQEKRSSDSRENRALKGGKNKRLKERKLTLFQKWKSLIWLSSMGTMHHWKFHG